MGVMLTQKARIDAEKGEEGGGDREHPGGGGDTEHPGGDEADEADVEGLEEGIAAVKRIHRFLQAVQVGRAT